MDDLVITGAGVITSIGRGRFEFFEALCRGESGLGPLAYFEPRLFKQRSAYEIRGQAEPLRSSRLLGLAARQALQDAGVEADEHGMVVVVGTGLRELRSVELWHAEGGERSRGHTRQTDHASGAACGDRPTHANSTLTPAADRCSTAAKTTTRPCVRC